MRTQDQLDVYDRFMKRGAEVGFMQALDEFRDKARAEAIRESAKSCPGECVNPLRARFDYLVRAGEQR